MEAALIIDVDRLSVDRGDRSLFRGLSFRIAAGQAVALTGANGAGKTSLLRAVAGLLRPVGGAVRWNTADGERPQLHLLGHQDGLKTGRTVAEELAFWTRWLGGSEVDRLRAVWRFELARLLDLEVRRLSAGQRRRVALTRLLAAPRPVWLLDEPMAPLDGTWRSRFGEVMAEHLAGGGIILAAVHDPLPIPHRTIEVGQT